MTHTNGTPFHTHELLHDAAAYAQTMAQRLKEYCTCLAYNPLTILDVGCGQGLLTNYVQELFFNAQVIGIDEDKEALHRARQQYPTLCFVDPATVYHTNALFYDMIYAANTFHHIAPHERATQVRLLMSLLKPGGLFVLLELNPYNVITRFHFFRNPEEKNASLLSAPHAQQLLHPFGNTQTTYYAPTPAFLFPLEKWLAKIPLGKWYIVSCIKN